MKVNSPKKLGIALKRTISFNKTKLIKVKTGNLPDSFGIKY